MPEILELVIKMLRILTELYEKDMISREQYAEHSGLKAAYLADRLNVIGNPRDMNDAQRVLNACLRITHPASKPNAGLSS